MKRWLIVALIVAAASAAWALQRNVAGQVICSQLTNATDGSVVTTGTTTVYVVGDGGVQSAGTGTVSHKGNGLWCYQLTRANTNYNHAAFTFSNPASLTSTVQMYPERAVR